MWIQARWHDERPVASASGTALLRAQHTAAEELKAEAKLAEAVLGAATSNPATDTAFQLDLSGRRKPVSRKHGRPAPRARPDRGIPKPLLVFQLLDRLAMSKCLAA